MEKSCLECRQNFEISAFDLEFYDRISPLFQKKKYAVPPPNLCPPCRHQRRLAWRNERHLYHRKCDFTGKQIISMYSPEATFPVYSPEAFFGDGWDARDYGQEFDFSRPFFDQFNDLQKKVPRLSLISSNNENCDYCNTVGDSRNCYLIYGSIYCEDCYYGNPFNCKNCVDSLLLRNSEWSCECTDSNKLYECYFCENCSNSSFLKFCYAVDNSQHCFGCVGLNKKKYCFFNEQCSPEDYEKKLAEIKLGSPEVQRLILQKLEHLKKTVPQRYYIGTNNQNVSGNYIFNSKNARDVFHVEKTEDVRFCTQLLESKDCYDVDCGEYGELVYETVGIYHMQNSLFCHWCWDFIFDSFYSSICLQNTRNCFGCIALKHGSYCILNKQYSKEEYKNLVPKIIEHMQKTGEWGEFFPISNSTFGYNETLAQEYFPLAKKEVVTRGWRWQEEEKAASYLGPSIKVPEDISAADESICSQILLCEVTGQPYKIIPQELKFYQKMGWPLPRKCPDERHRERVALRNPRRLWDRKCMKCGRDIRTSYAPERPETVYCEECYQREVY